MDRKYRLLVEEKSSLSLSLSLSLSRIAQLNTKQLIFANHRQAF
jgi:hypothetical protein